MVAAVGAKGRLGDPAELEAFLDGVMAATLRDHHVAGAAVAVVKDGALLLAKGYGYADVEARQPVDPDRTLFRVGSVTKLMTWTDSGRLWSVCCGVGTPDSAPRTPHIL